MVVWHSFIPGQLVARAGIQLQSHEGANRTHGEAVGTINPVLLWKQHPGTLEKTALPESSAAKFGHSGAKGARPSGVASPPGQGCPTSMEKLLWEAGGGISARGCLHGSPGCSGVPSAGALAGTGQPGQVFTSRWAWLACNRPSSPTSVSAERAFVPSAAPQELPGCAPGFNLKPVEPSKKPGAQAGPVCSFSPFFPSETVEPVPQNCLSKVPRAVVLRSAHLHLVVEVWCTGRRPNSTAWAEHHHPRPSSPFPQTRNPPSRHQIFH